MSFSGGTLFVSATSIVFTMITFLSLCVVAVFSILSRHFVKKNTISTDSASSSSTVKTAVTKILLFHSVKAAILTVQLSIILIHFADLDGSEGNGLVAIILLIIFYYIMEVIFGITTLLTPAVSIFYLKPVHTAMKQMGKKLGFCYKTI